MSDDDLQEEKPMSMSESASHAAIPPPSSAGARLRAARQAQGLHIAALAAQLKVPQAKLEALEADRVQDLPDATFMRALAQAMCRALKIDADPVLALLPRGAEPALDRVAQGLNQPFRERSGRGEPITLDWLKRPMIWGPLLLLVAALAVYLMPADWQLPQLPQQQAPQAQGSESGSAEPVAAQAPAVEASAPPVFPASAVAVTAPVVAAPLAPAAPALAGSAPAVLQLGQVPLRIAAREESWVEVTDAHGQVLFTKLMRPAEVVELGVTPPLRLRIGNVSGTEVRLRGQAVDIAGPSRDNILRLELK